MNKISGKIGRPPVIRVSTALVVIILIFLPYNWITTISLLAILGVTVFACWSVVRDLFHLFMLLKASDQKISLPAMHDLFVLYTESRNPSVAFEEFHTFRSEVGTYIQHKDDFEQKKIAAAASSEEETDLLTQISVYNDLCMRLLELSRGKNGRKRRALIHSVSEELNTRIVKLSTSPRINNFRATKKLLESSIDTFRRRTDFIIEQREHSQQQQQKVQASLPKPTISRSQTTTRPKKRNKRHKRTITQIDVGNWNLFFVSHPGAKRVKIDINNHSFETLIQAYSKNINPSILRKQIGVLLHMDSERRRHFPKTKEVFSGFQKRPSGSLRIFFQINEEMNEFTFGVKHRKELPPQYR